MTQTVETPAVDLEGLRRAIQAEYALVAQEPEHGFHFLVGRPLAAVLGYAEAWLEGIPEPTIASFAGTITSRTDIYAGAEQSSSAAEFGTLGLTFRARKASNDEEWQQALAALTCDIQGAN